MALTRNRTIFRPSSVSLRTVCRRSSMPKSLTWSCGQSGSLVSSAVSDVLMFSMIGHVSAVVKESEKSTKDTKGTKLEVWGE